MWKAAPIAAATVIRVNDGAKALSVTIFHHVGLYRFFSPKDFSISPSKYSTILSDSSKTMRSEALSSGKFSRIIRLVAVLFFADL
jgi:hypothetical protein